MGPPVKNLSNTVFLLALCVGGTAVAQDVRYNFEASADFTKYHSYRWAQHPDSLQVDQLVLSQMGAAFDAELAKKGLQKATGDSCDLVIVYQLGNQQEKELTTFDSGWSSGPGWRNGWYSGAGGVSSATTSTINIGAVGLDMYDSSAKTLVWRGTVSKALAAGANPDKQQGIWQRLRRRCSRTIRRQRNRTPPTLFAAPLGQ